MENLNSEQTVSASANVCEKCGSLLEQGQMFCGNCGQKIGVSLEPRVSSAINEFNSQIEAPQKRNSSKVVVIIIAVIVAIVAIYWIVKSQQKSALAEKLQDEEWWTFEDDTQLYLEFSDDEIEYSGDFGILGRREIATMDYEVVDGDTIEVEGQEIEVEMDDDSVVFTPSFINADSYSLWLN